VARLDGAHDRDQLEDLVDTYQPGAEIEIDDRRSGDDVDVVGIVLSASSTREP